jgi:hypothetical protein
MAVQQREASKLARVHGLAYEAAVCLHVCNSEAKPQPTYRCLPEKGEEEMIESDRSADQPTHQLLDSEFERVVRD